MSNYKTKGYILRRTNFGEADRMLTVFTQDIGKIKTVAKGVRKQNSRLGGNLELFCLTNLVVAKGRNLDIVTEAEIVDPCIRLRDDLDKAHVLFYLSEIIDKLTVEHVEHVDIFELLRKTVNKLETTENKLLVAYFELNFLKMIGYEPELAKCIKCRKTARSKDNSFDCEEGGLVCGGCGQGVGGEISDEAIKVMRLFLAKDIAVLDKLKLNAKLSREIENVLKNYIAHVHQDEFKSRRFLKNQ